MDDMTIQNPPYVVFTSHYRNQKIGKAFADGCGGVIISVENFMSSPNKTSIATYGILRGSGECIKEAENFWYIDHGYFKRSTCLDRCEGYFRVVKNALWHDGSGDHTWDRFNNLQIGLKDWRKNGDHVVVVPPSGYMGGFFLGLENWLNDVLVSIKQYTDRPVVVSDRHNLPISEVLKNAWVVVTDHSNAAIDAMIEGVPAIMTNPSRKLGSIEEIENPPMSRDIFRNLANCQWTLEEMRSGQAWGELNA